jgi:oligopeptide transport system ATP-binding protein
MKDEELDKLRGASMSMIFQDPMTSLNPFLRVSTQLTEVLIKHRGMGKAEAMQQAIAMLERVSIPDAAKRIRLYPHEFSGGMRQRVMISMALLCQPALLFADEPTTALDVTVQAEILDLLRTLKEDRKMALLLVTHDLGVVADTCDRVAVMYAGQVVEQGSTAEVLSDPRHPYTKGLLGSMPGRGGAGSRLTAIRGAVPAPRDWPAWCRFEPRCPVASDACRAGAIAVARPGPGRLSRCVLSAGRTA